MLIVRWSQIIVLLTAAFSCQHPGKTGNPVPIIKKELAYAKEPNDSASYNHVKYDFYLSKDAQLCERKLVGAGDTSCYCEFKVYYDSLFSIFTGDTTIRKPLGSIIDISSFVQLDSTEYAKDKKNVYYFAGNSDGGTRSIVQEADPKTFRRLCEYRWGIDKQFVFWKNKKLPGLHVKKLQVLYSPDSTDRFVSYVKDDRIVYHENELLQGADAKTFKVVKGQKWEAEDKNKKYGDIF